MDITLNLIPPEKKETICQVRKVRRVWRWEAQLTFVVAIFVGLLLVTRYIEQINGDALVEGDAIFESQKSQRERVLAIQGEWREANRLVGDVASVQNDQVRWSQFFTIVNKNLPSGVALEEEISNGYNVTLAGKAQTREALIQFKDNLAATDCFSQTELPFSNLVSKQNVDFKIELTINKQCLQ